MIAYKLELLSPKNHRVRVTQTFTQESQAPTRLTMPAWLPGSYTLRNFSKHIVSIKAYAFDAPSRALVIEKVDSHTYQLESIEAKVVVEYEVYCWDRSVRGSHLDISHGFFNGSSLFLFPQTMKHMPVELLLEKPRWPTDKPWQVTTTLRHKVVDEQGFGVYTAPDYEHLIDHPIEMGTHALHSFEAAGVVHQVALLGAKNTDVGRLTSDVAKICEEHVSLYGEVPFNQYLFLLTVLENGYGGLEHKDSTALICFNRCLPYAQIDMSQYKLLLGLFSHEYFHAWFVKRIKPLEFYNLDLTTEHHTKQLWAFEGFTSYYDDLALVRSGVISVEDYLQTLSETITRVHQTNGHRTQTVKDSSFDAWTKFYHPNENSPNVQVSYYTKGALCALIFDLSIRRFTQGKNSLDDVVRKLWQNYGSQNIGVPEGRIEQMLEEVGSELMRPIVHTALNTTEPLPLEDFFDDVGIAIEWQYPNQNGDADSPPLDMGWQLKGKSGLEVAQVYDDGPAFQAGVCAQDELVALDKVQLSSQNLPALLSRFEAGTSVDLHVFRDNQLVALTVELKATEKTKAVLKSKDALTDAQVEQFKAWLKDAR